MRVIIDRFAWVKKSDLTIEQVTSIKKDLTVTPREDQYNEDPKPIKLYVESEEALGMAREYYLKKRKPEHQIEWRTTDGAEWINTVVFKGSLRVQQEEAVCTAVNLFNGGNCGGIIKAPAGSGKTVLACALLARVQVPTLVLVHKEFFLEQWSQRLQQFIPNVQIGVVQGSKCDFVGKHVVIGMLQSLASKRYYESFYKYFGLVISDEVHRVGAATWCNVIAQFPAKRRLGLTATPRRRDKCEQAFYDHVGPIIYAATEIRLRPKIKRVWTDFKLTSSKRLNPNLSTNLSLTTKLLVACGSRNRTIIDQLVKAINAGRKIIVLSHRRPHLENIKDALQAYYSDKESPTIGFYVGGLNEDKREKASRCQVILATVQMASEGLDIPALDTLFLTTPISDVEQAVGRILRPFHGEEIRLYNGIKKPVAKKEPIVVDFRDDRISLLKGLATKRDAYYSKVAI